MTTGEGDAASKLCGRKEWKECEQRNGMDGNEKRKMATAEGRTSSSQELGKGGRDVGGGCAVGKCGPRYRRPDLSRWSGKWPPFQGVGSFSFLISDPVPRSFTFYDVVCPFPFIQVFHFTASFCLAPRPAVFIFISSCGAGHMDKYSQWYWSTSFHFRLPSEAD